MIRVSWDIDAVTATATIWRATLQRKTNSGWVTVEGHWTKLSAPGMGDPDLADVTAAERFMTALSGTHDEEVAEPAHYWDTVTWAALSLMNEELFAVPVAPSYEDAHQARLAAQEAVAGAESLQVAVAGCPGGATYAWREDDTQGYVSLAVTGGAVNVHDALNTPSLGLLEQILGQVGSEQIKMWAEHLSVPTMR